MTDRVMDAQMRGALVRVLVSSLGDRGGISKNPEHYVVLSDALSTALEYHVMNRGHFLQPLEHFVSDLRSFVKHLASG